MQTLHERLEHKKMPYPHGISCPNCRMENVCNHCGKENVKSGNGRCTNGRCRECCAKHCRHMTE
jgi:hypothetical protein